MPQTLRAEGPSAGLPQLNTVNLRLKSIQQCTNQITNTPFLQLTESLTSGHYARSPETVHRQTLCSTFLRSPLAHHLLVPTPLSAIPFVSTLYQQFERCGFLPIPKSHTTQKAQISNGLHMLCNWISLGICKWKVLRFCHSPHFCESFLIGRYGGLWTTLELFAEFIVCVAHNCIPIIHKITITGE
jgi:hypothetical protein